MTYNIDEAKTQLSRLVQRAADGEEIVITDAGRPMAKRDVENDRSSHTHALLGAQQLAPRLRC